MICRLYVEIVKLHNQKADIKLSFSRLPPMIHSFQKDKSSAIRRKENGMIINPQTGKELRLTERIITFGLCEAENDWVERHKPNEACEVMPTDVITDLYAYRSFATIIRAESLGAVELGKLRLYYRELENAPTVTVFWIGESTLPACATRMMRCYPSWDDLRAELPKELLKAYRCANETRRLWEEVALSIRVLRQIEGCPGIRSGTLASLLSISRRSVRRYIDVLRCADENVKYDPSLYGWVLEPLAEQESATNTET